MPAIENPCFRFSVITAPSTRGWMTATEGCMRTSLGGSFFFFLFENYKRPSSSLTFLTATAETEDDESRNVARHGSDFRKRGLITDPAVFGIAKRANTFYSVVLLKKRTAAICLEARAHPA